MDYLNYKGWQIRIDQATHTAYVGALGKLDPATNRAAQPAREFAFGPFTTDAEAIAAAQSAIDERAVD